MASNDVTEPQPPVLGWQPRPILATQDFADVLDGQYRMWRLRPTSAARYLDNDDPTTDPLEDLIRKGFA